MKYSICYLLLLVVLYIFYNNHYTFYCLSYVHFIYLATHFPFFLCVCTLVDEATW